MIKKAYKIDENGLYTEDYIYEDGQELETDIITTEIPQGFYKPKWNGTEWIEGATQEYIDSMNPTVIQEPTLADRISDIEIAFAEMIGGIS